MRLQDSPSSNPADVNGRRSSLGPGHDEGAPSRARRDEPGSDTAHHHTDDAESVTGDTLNTVGSASSHESSSSSLFSSSTRQATGTLSKTHNSTLTPLTTIDSPSHANPAGSAKAHSTTPQHSSRANGFLPTSNPGTNGASTPVPRIAELAPARNPGRSVKGVKCIYDPALDRSLSNSDRRKAKPRYKEFGLVRTHIIIYTQYLGRGGERHLFYVNKPG